MKFSLLGSLGCCLLLGTSLIAQDPFFQHFYGNESSYNPAYVGKRGAMSVTFKQRAQWGASSAQAYRTHQVLFEDSAPCFFMDWGAVATHNVEGEGLLATTEFGLRSAFFIPVGQGNRRTPTKYLGNIRVGFGLHYGQRSIDFDRLVFLDQLDPLYGLVNREMQPNQTDFEAPATNNSPWYFSPSIGVMYRYVVDTELDDSWAFDVGAAVHNWGGLISRDSRQSASLLGLDNQLGERYVLSLAADKVLTKDKGRYWAIHPQAVYQSQQNLRYLETGSTLSWSGNFTFGLFYHLAAPTNLDQPNSNWTSLQLEMGKVIPNTSTRIDLGFSFAIQHGGLKNFVRAPFEFTAIMSFASSATCNFIGRQGEVPYNTKGVHCKRFNVSPSRRKLYDDIWYNGKSPGGKTTGQ